MLSQPHAERVKGKLLEHTATIDDDFWTSSRRGASLQFARSSIMHQLQQAGGISNGGG